MAGQTDFAARHAAVGLHLPPPHDQVVLRGISRFFGGIMVLSSVGIWAVPAGAGDPGLVLMKLLVSVVLAVVGALLVEAGRPWDADEVHFDPAAREVRQIRRSGGGRHTLVARHSFDDIADVRLRAGVLSVVSTGGAVVVQVPMSSMDNIADLKRLLGASPATVARSGLDDRGGVPEAV